MLLAHLDRYKLPGEERFQFVIRGVLAGYNCFRYTPLHAHGKFQVAVAQGCLEVTHTLSCVIRSSWGVGRRLK
jgi:hypothetical protein